MEHDPHLHDDEEQRDDEDRDQREVDDGGKDSTTGAVVRSPARLVTVDGLDSERDAEAFRWRFVIAAEVARAERERIKQRNIDTKQRLANSKRFPGGAIPFGCQVVERPDPTDGGKVGKYLERNEAEAIILEEVSARLLRGDSVRQCVFWMPTTPSRSAPSWPTTQAPR